MTVDPATVQHIADHDGRRYYFCAAGCRTAFHADPDRYTAGSPAAASVGGRVLDINPRTTDHGAQQ